jgi:general secretion pathway protein B
MSFILDALKKSETERQRADAPALYEMKMAPARRRVATWLIVLAALLVINVVVLSVVLLRGNHGAAPQPEASAGTPAPAAVSPSLPPPASPPPIATPPAPTETAAAPPADNAGGTSGASAGGSDDDAPAVNPARTAATSTDTPDVPSYQEVSSAPGANLPELKLDLHAYASNPADRFIFLNGVNLKEGQTSPAGVRVEAITPDGAILSWHGTRFLLHSQ